MRVIAPVIFIIFIIGFLSIAEIYLLKKLHKDWWSRRWVRYCAFTVPIFGAAGMLLWLYGILYRVPWVLAFGAYLTAVASVAGVALMLSLPVSALFHGAANLADRRRRRKAPEELLSPGRRKILKTSAVFFPAITMTAGGSGLVQAFSLPRTPVVPLAFPDLPVALDGLRILHITDLHIGFFVSMEDLAEIVEFAKTIKPDLVLLTGDLSDDITHYPDVLRLLSRIPARYGTFASVGNHEYYRGLREVRAAYDASPIPLLLDSGASVSIGDARLYLAGADDPRSLGGLTSTFFQQTIDKARRGAPSDAFTILMSHRPEGFDYAAEIGIPLTISGHTHGGQIGFQGRSIWEPLMNKRYMWGMYRKGKSTLYTSAGTGHWFPYRLGCPAEMPIYVLKKN